MIILFLFGLMGFVAIVCIIIAICAHDYTKDPKTGEDIEEKIDDFLLKP